MSRMVLTQRAPERPQRRLRQAAGALFTVSPGQPGFSRQGAQKGGEEGGGPEAELQRRHRACRLQVSQNPGGEPGGPNSGASGENSCARERIPCIFPAQRKQIPCSPAPGARDMAVGGWNPTCFRRAERRTGAGFPGKSLRAGNFPAREAPRSRADACRAPRQPFL